jgi:hypothetical protein
MQIHYCFTCNSRVDSDEAVTLGDKVYCRPCANKAPGADDNLPAGRNTPSRGLQRRTPGKPGSHSPARGVQTQSPARSSKYGLKPATATPPSGSGTPARTGMRASSGNAIPVRASGGNTPPRGSGGHTLPARRPSGGNPVLKSQESGRREPVRESRSASDEQRQPRSNNTLIWVLAGVALLLAGIGAALIVSGNTITRPPSSATEK